MSLKIINTGGSGGLTIQNTGGVGSFTITKTQTPISIVTDGLTLRLDAKLNPPDMIDGSYLWVDLAGTQQNIQLMGNPPFTSGSPSYITFDGSTQYGRRYGGVNPVLTNSSYSKSVWFYLNDYADNNLVSSIGGGHFMYMAGTNRIYCGHADWPNYQVYPSTSTISLNTWYNATVTFNTTDGMILYINGVKDSEYTENKDSHSGDNSINIASFNDGNLLNGRISKVYCYNKSLTAEEVLQNYNFDKSEFGL